MTEKLLSRPEDVIVLGEKEHQDKAEYAAAQQRRASEVATLINLEVKRRKAEGTESVWSEHHDTSDREVVEGVRKDIVSELAGALYAATPHGQSVQEQIRGAELHGDADEKARITSEMNAEVRDIENRLTPDPTEFNRQADAYQGEREWETGTGLFAQDLVYKMVDVQRELGLIDEAPQRELAAA